MAIADLIKLAEEQYYAEGVDRCGDKYRGDSVSAWIIPVPFGQCTPNPISITTGAIAADAETATLTAPAGTTVDLFRGDVLWFNTSQRLIVLSGDVTLTDAGVAAPIFAAEGAVADTEIALTYAMKPIFSFESGWLVQSSGSEATSRNRGQSLYSAKEVVGRDSSTSGEGSLVRNDPGLAVIDNLKRGNGRCYIEARLQPFDSYGISPVSEGLVSFVNSTTPTASASDFIKYSVDMMGDGAPRKYAPLGMDLATAKLLLPNDVYVQTLNNF